MARIPIALQLYSVRDDCARDLPGVLKEVARMGYEGVEFAGYYGRDAATLKRIIREPTSEYPDTLMPPFAERLSEQQLDALVQYLANRH